MKSIEIEQLIKRLNDESDKILVDIKKNVDDKDETKKLRKELVAINAYIIATIKYKNSIDTL